MTTTNPKPAKDETPDNSIGETIRTILFAMLIALVIRTFAFEPFNIPSSSMVPSLLVGDFLFVSKFSYGYGSIGTFWGLPSFKGRIGGGEPQRGDVVVFKTPTDNKTDFIKRLIGLPGDKIEMRHGILWINGSPADRDRLEAPINADGEPINSTAVDYNEHLPGGVTHVIRKLYDERGLNNTGPITVPDHQYFFMGDNRDDSSDSRVIGPVAEENLVGKAEFLFFSLRDDAPFWQFWRWPWTVRWDRLFMSVN